MKGEWTEEWALHCFMVPLVVPDHQAHRCAVLQPLLINCGLVHTKLPKANMD